MNINDKRLYVDIVKLNTTITTKYHNKIKILVNKIIKNIPEKISSEITNIIVNSSDIIKSMIDINNIINNNNINKLIGTQNNNHEWVSKRLINILQYFNINNNIKIGDIGGGEGNILIHMSNEYNISNKNLYCIENKCAWSESYTFQNNINYIFWDNNFIDLPDNYLDVIIIMVSLHHMTDETIQQLMINISRIIKPEGLIIIKEHDKIKKQDKNIIDWEHHLYHILMTEDINEENLNEYCKSFINNYKSKSEYDKLFKLYDFNSIVRLDRTFNIFSLHDNNNITNLYWNIYSKNNFLI